MSKFYTLKNSLGQYLAHKGTTKWTDDKRLAHFIRDCPKKGTPKSTWVNQKAYGEAVTTEDAE